MDCSPWHATPLILRLLVAIEWQEWQGARGRTFRRSTVNRSNFHTDHYEVIKAGAAAQQSRQHQERAENNHTSGSINMLRPRVFVWWREPLSSPKRLRITWRRSSIYLPLQSHKTGSLLCSTTPRLTPFFVKPGGRYPSFQVGQLAAYSRTTGLFQRRSPPPPPPQLWPSPTPRLLGPIRPDQKQKKTKKKNPLPLLPILPFLFFPSPLPPLPPLPHA